MQRHSRTLTPASPVHYYSALYTLKQLGPPTCHSDRREESKSFAVVMRPAQLRDLSWLTRALDSSLRFATFGMTCARLGKVLLTEED